jgi:hypothetical protein
MGGTGPFEEDERTSGSGSNSTSRIEEELHVDKREVEGYDDPDNDLRR